MGCIGARTLETCPPKVRQGGALVFRFAKVGEHNSMILGYLGFMVDISKLDGEKSTQSTDFLEVAPPCSNGGGMSN